MTDDLPAIRETGSDLDSLMDDGGTHGPTMNTLARSAYALGPPDRDDVGSMRSFSPSLNEGLAAAPMATGPGDRSSMGSPSRAYHRRQLSDMSFANMDDSSLSLGVNHLSEATVSPLGPNSVYELVENTNYRRNATSTGLLTLGSSPVSINVKGAPTTRDIPRTSLTPINKVANTQFQPYLHTIEEPYNEFHSHKTLTESTLEAFMTQLSEEEKERKHNERIHEQNREGGSDLSANTDFGVAVAEDEDSLKQVPKVFFSNDFRLDDPRVFNEVIGDSTILKDTVTYREDGERKPMIDHEAVQERLSSNLDVVEIHLIHEISKSSGSFFSALGDLKDITTKSGSLAKELQGVDSKLEDMDKNRTAGAIETLKLAQKRNNVEKLEQTLLQVSTVMHYADLAESSYFNANYDKALELTDAVFSLMKGNNSNKHVAKLTEKWAYPLQDVSKVPALAPLKRLLSNLIADTGKSVANMFSDFLIEDLRGNYENVSKGEVMGRLADQKAGRHVTIGNSETYNNISDDFRAQSQKYIQDLARCGELASAYKLYEERFLAELKNIIRSHLPTDILENGNGTRSGTSVSGRSDESRSTTATGRSSTGGLSGNVRAMTPKEFEDLLVATYSQLSEALRRLTVHKKLLLQQALDAEAVQDSRFMDNQPDLVVQLDMTNAITSAIDIAQRRMAKIVNVREAQNSCVTLDYFLRLYSVNSMFLNECELISGGRMESPVLKDVMNIQLRKFVQQYHRSSLNILGSQTEREIWKERMLPSSVQVLTNQIVTAADDDFDPTVWTNPMNLELRGQTQAPEQQPKPAEPSTTTTEPASPEKSAELDERKTLLLGEDSYIVPELAIHVLNMLKSYEIMKLQFPNTDPQFVIDLLKMVNLKIHSSVLGAQATRTAGLRNITSKHLAVTSQLLGFIAAIIPYVKSLYMRKSKGDFNGDEFDKVAQNFADQQQEIFDKLVAIMVDRVASQADEIKGTDWSRPLPQQKSHRYMESLVSKTLTIARILQRYLPERQYTHVLGRIFESYKQMLTDIYSNVPLKDSVDKAVMMRDVDYFREKLVDVAGYGDSGQVIWENVNSLPTDEDARVQQPKMVKEAAAVKKPANPVNSNSPTNPDSPANPDGPAAPAGPASPTKALPELPHSETVEKVDETEAKISLENKQDTCQEKKKASPEFEGPTQAVNTTSAKQKLEERLKRSVRKNSSTEETDDNPLPADPDSTEDDMPFVLDRVKEFEKLASKEAARAKDEFVSSRSASPGKLGQSKFEAKADVATEKPAAEMKHADEKKEVKEELTTEKDEEKSEPTEEATEVKEEATEVKEEAPEVKEEEAPEVKEEAEKAETVKETTEATEKATEEPAVEETNASVTEEVADLKLESEKESEVEPEETKPEVKAEPEVETKAETGAEETKTETEVEETKAKTEPVKEEAEPVKEEAEPVKEEAEPVKEEVEPVEPEVEEAKAVVKETKAEVEETEDQTKEKPAEADEATDIAKSDSASTTATTETNSTTTTSNSQKKKRKNKNKKKKKKGGK